MTTENTTLILKNAQEKTPKIHTFWRLIGYIKSYKVAITLAVLGFVLSAGAQTGIAYLLKLTADVVQAVQSNSYSLSGILPITIDLPTAIVLPSSIVVFFIFRGTGAFLANYYSAVISRNLVYQLRLSVFSKLLRLPSRFYLENSSGTISAKLMYDVEQVSAASISSIKVLIQDSLTVIFLLTTLLYINWKLSLVLFLILPPIFGLVRFATKRFAKFSREIQNTMGNINHISTEMINGYQVVKNYGGQNYEMQRFDKNSKDNLEQGLKIVVTDSISSPIIQLLLSIALSFVIWIALSPDVMGNTSVGEFMAYLGAAGLLSAPIQRLTNVNQSLQRGIAGAESIFALLDEEEENDKGKQSKDIAGNIRFDNISLTYEDGITAISNFNLNIKSGETIAVVGRSGAGKTSLVNLLTRTLEANQGKIYIDDIAIEDYKLDSLRSQISMVNQKVTLFNDTVRNNIAYGRLNEKSFDEVIKASKSAFAYDFINTLPNGFDSEIGAEGLQLSGGQRQRLSIARALLKDAPILILDEATSALDNESEFYIQQALDNIMKDRTTLVIAHRLTTIESADRIVVMDKGQIVEVGSHEELMAKHGVYAQMYDRNFDEDLPM